MDILINFGLFLLGAIFGSFAGAQVWRLRALQLVADKKAGEKVDIKELERLKPLIGKKLKHDRSKCLSCNHDLAWHDLLPVVSWLSLRGKCRYCRQFIGWTELILELSVGLMFVLTVVFWPASLSEPVELSKLAIWLVALVALAINFVYDMKWSLLVTKLNWLLIVTGLLFAMISIIQASDWLAALISTACAVLVLGGLYLLLWLTSRGRWVGEGDIYLGAGLALFLGDWRLAFVALFAANLIGTIIVLPGMLTGKLRRGSHMPFGPLLILGGLMAWFVGQPIIDWYTSLVFLM